MNTVQSLLALSGLFVAIMVPFVGAVYFFGRKLGRIEGQIAAFTGTLSALGQTVGGLAAIVPDQERRIEITRALATGLNPPRAHNDPFSNEEAALYNRYVQMAQNGEWF